jgi:hypothetical protein
MAATLRFFYAILDQLYRHGRLNYVMGDDGDPVANVKDPQDTGVNDIDPYTDNDPEVFSYMGGAAFATPRAVLCNVTTNFSTTPATSTGKYSVCTPSSGWAITGPKDIALQNSGADVAGNPYGIAQAGGFLYLVDYDSANIYTLDIAAFEAAAGPTYQVNAVTPVPVTPPANSYVHGAALLVLTNGNATYLYALFNIDNGSGGSYQSSVLVRYSVNTSTGALTNPMSVTLAGLNAQALVPAPSTADGTAILIPSIGGSQGAGNTNGTASTLEYVPAFGGFETTKRQTAFTGDGTPQQTPVTPTGTYDIRGVAVSEDGAYAYLLTGTGAANYTGTFWRLYQTTVANILSSVNIPLSTASVLNPVDSTVDTANGDPGYYWEVQYENASPATNGRLWFVKGSPIRISLGNNYSTFKLIDAGSGGPLYSPAFNVNSADLIGEMIYQASKGVSKDTRLVKGSARQAAQAAKSASVAEEEKN